MDYNIAPTINEIVYNRPAPAESRDFSFSTGAGLFRVGDVVRFFFGTVIRTGRVTNSVRHGLSYIYNIETAGHTWYRGITQENIISKTNYND